MGKVLSKNAVNIVGGTSSAITAEDFADPQFWGPIIISIAVDTISDDTATRHIGLAMLPMYIDDQRLIDALTFGGYVDVDTDIKAYIAAAVIAPPSPVTDFIQDYIAGAVFGLALQDSTLTAGPLLADYLNDASIFDIWMPGPTLAPILTSLKTSLDFIAQFELRNDQPGHSLTEEDLAEYSRQMGYYPIGCKMVISNPPREPSSAAATRWLWI